LTADCFHLSESLELKLLSVLTDIHPAAGFGRDE
jgi:hypothetical protein